MIGTSMITRGGLPQGLLFADACGCTAAQLYVAPSRAWAVPVLPQSDIDLFARRWAASGVKEVIAHASLLLNLASPNPELWRKSVDRLVAEVCRCRELGIRKIVFHPGSNPDKVLGAKLVCEGLDEIADRTSDVTILIENMAGQGNTLGSRFEEIAWILGHIRDSKRFGVCVDTCHAFAAGYDIRGHKGYEHFVEHLEEVVALRSIGAFHVNDSKVELGRRVDRHSEVIGEGHVGIETFVALLSDSRFFNIPMIAEVPNGEVFSEPAVTLLHGLRRGVVPTQKRVLQETLF